MPIDFQVFLSVNIFAVFFIVMGFLGDEKFSIFPFAGGVMLAWFLTSMTDGNLTTAYAYTSAFQFNNMADTQIIYVPVLLTYLSFLAAIWQVLGDSPKGKMIGSVTFLVSMAAIVAYSVTGMLTNLDTAALTNASVNLLVIIQTDIPFTVAAAILFMIIGGTWKAIRVIG